MGRNTVNFYVLFILSGVVPLLNSQHCDQGKPGSLQEGNLGQDGWFPWLGALRVHLHDGATFKVAVTVIVLIKDKFALANAHDIVRIPRDVFKGDSIAMFIPDRNKLWSTPVEDYVAHPEYDASTINTIAVIELKIEIDEFNPIKPICWPKYSFNTSNHLYVIGYTDENQLLEKELHKLQFVKEKYCDEFYSRAKLNVNKVQPLHVQCAFAEKLKMDCVWETGQVMASNSTGPWTMIGLGVHGPGCAAPARFISFIPYMEWIKAVTDMDEINDYRKSAFGTGFRRRRPAMGVPEEPPDVPVHETFLREGNQTTIDPETITHPYQINYENLDKYEIDRIDVDEIAISIFDNMYESTPKACEALKSLVYKDETKIVTSGIYGSAAYKLTLHDINVLGYSCIIVKVNSLTRERAKLWWKKTIDKYEAVLFEDMGYLPKRLIKIIPVESRMPQHGGPSDSYKPGKHMEAQQLLDLGKYEGLENINLLLKFKFKGNATLRVTVYGPPYPPLGYTTTPKSLRMAPYLRSDEEYQFGYETVPYEPQQEIMSYENYPYIPSQRPSERRPSERRPSERRPSERRPSERRPSVKNYNMSLRRNPNSLGSSYSSKSQARKKKRKLQKALERETERKLLERKHE